LEPLDDTLGSTGLELVAFLFASLFRFGLKNMHN